MLLRTEVGPVAFEVGRDGPDETGECRVGEVYCAVSRSMVWIGAGGGLDITTPVEGVF